MTYLEKYNFWRTNKYFDENIRKELEEIKDNTKEIEERFYRELEFGTGGLRGIIGAGTNRMNIYTVRKATQGLANFICSNGEAAKNKGVAIAYDSRHKSPEFAMEAAKVLAANGVKAYIFDELRPTPMLSFAVRFLGAAAGIVITASHNPKEYNGYKVYGEDGGQLPVSASNIVLEEINKLEDLTGIVVPGEDEAKNSGLITVIGKEVDDAYMKKLHELAIHKELVDKYAPGLKIVYTPIHGSGNKPVRRILKEMGYENILIVKEQEKPDPNFSTVKSPNPEEKEALSLAIELAKKENVSLIIGTDPDSDRVGVVVKNAAGEYMTLTGNQTGCLLLEYVLSQKKKLGKLPENGFVVKTIVTTEMSRIIAKEYNIELVEVLTGFKFIGEKIKQLDEFGDKKYLFGFEESYGYLAGTFVRDKDAVIASMLIAEMAVWYESRNMTLYEGLEELYKKYGYYKEGITSFTLSGKEGLEKIKGAMDTLRKEDIRDFGAFRLKARRDYEESKRVDYMANKIEEIDLPESDVLYYEFTDGSWFCIRPSGTEPKIKIYYGVSEKSETLTINKLNDLKAEVLKVVDPLLSK